MLPVVSAASSDDSSPSTKSISVTRCTLKRRIPSCRLFESAACARATHALGRRQHASRTVATQLSIRPSMWAASSSTDMPCRFYRVQDIGCFLPAIEAHVILNVPAGLLVRKGCRPFLIFQVAMARPPKIRITPGSSKRRPVECRLFHPVERFTLSVERARRTMV